jgi:hypothetical protein
VNSSSSSGTSDREVCGMDEKHKYSDKGQMEIVGQ